MNNDYFGAALDPLGEVWAGVLGFVPKLIGALLLFIFGWIIGAVLGRVVATFIRALKVDNALKQIGADSVLARGGFTLDTGAFFGTLVKWFFIIVGLIAAVDVIGLSRVNVFLERVVTVFLPDVIVAAFILVVGALVAHSLQKLVAGSAKAAEVPAAGFMGAAAKWAVWIFALLAALNQLGIGGPFAPMLFQALVASLAIAFGLAFGLGGKDSAAAYLAHLHKDVRGGK